MKLRSDDPKFQPCCAEWKRATNFTGCAPHITLDLRTAGCDDSWSDQLWNTWDGKPDPDDKWASPDRTYNPYMPAMRLCPWCGAPKVETHVA